MTRTTAIGTAALVVMLGCGLAGAETFEQAATAKGYTYASTDNINVWAYDAADPGATKMPGDVTSLAGVENYTACSGIIASHNQITSIATNQFAGMSNVTELFLGSNQIAGIEPGDLAGLSSLEGLYLSDNQIADIEATSFSGLGGLTYLSLSRNQIASIEPGDFSAVPGLTSLQLFENQLTSVEASDFSSLPSLAYLSLNNNQISSVEWDTFSPMADLNHLYLYGNQITSIGPNAFAGLSKLKRLVIGTRDGSNPLVSIGDNAFDGCTSLTKLSMGVITTLATLNFTGADFGDGFNIQLTHNVGLTAVDLTGASLTQSAFDGLMDPRDGDGDRVGVGELPGITSMEMDSADLSGVTNLANMYSMDDLVTLTMPYATVGDVNLIDDLSANLDSLDNLTLSDTQWDAMNPATQANLTAWDAEIGNTLTVIPEPVTLSLLALASLTVLHKRRKQ